MLAACTNETDNPDAGVSSGGQGECSVTAPTECPDPAPRYADVQPIFMERCVPCHIGERGGPWALTDYGHIKDWEDSVKGMMLTCAMPPPDAGIEMPDEERELILAWIRCDLPE